MIRMALRGGDQRPSFASAGWAQSGDVSNEFFTRSTDRSTPVRAPLAALIGAAFGSTSYVKAWVARCALRLDTPWAGLGC